MERTISLEPDFSCEYDFSLRVKKRGENMAFIFAVSDIHGHLDILQETLKNVDLTAKDNKLILLGDYIDRGDKSCETLYFIKEFSERCPGQVIPLMGNHEIMLLDDLDADYPMGEFSEIIKYISEDEYKVIVAKCNDSSDQLLQSMMVYKYVIALIKAKHKNLLAWLKSLPYIYETDIQIFVHAGIDEEAGEDWKWGTSDEKFVWKYPPQMGKFYKDIIAGHTHISTTNKDEIYHNVFWDKESHFFIDGATASSKIIPLLKYDTTKKRYSSFEKVLTENGDVVWAEYLIE